MEERGCSWRGGEQASFGRMTRSMVRDCAIACIKFGNEFLRNVASIRCIQ